MRKLKTTKMMAIGLFSAMMLAFSANPAKASDVSIGIGFNLGHPFSYYDHDRHYRHHDYYRHHKHWKHHRKHYRHHDRHYRRYDRHADYRGYRHDRYDRHDGYRHYRH